MGNEKKYELVTNGKEKSEEEIVLNNLINYMNEKGMDAEQQINYLKNSILYFQHLKDEHDKLNRFMVMASTISLAAITGVYYFNYFYEAKVLIASSTLLIAGKVIYTLNKKNPYKEAYMANSDVAEMYDTYKEIAPVLLKNNKRLAK